MKYFLILLSVVLLSCTETVKQQHPITVTNVTLVTCTINNVMIIGEIIGRPTMFHWRLRLFNDHVIVVNRKDCKLV
jgi:hypothetical protein